jgi:Zn-finger nucleic acid-binding protein
MAPLTLSSHTGRPVTVDHCGPCRQIWFDHLESVALDARGWIRLLRELQAGAAQPARPLDPAGGRLSCPTCRAELAQVFNRSRFGRFTSLECPRRHGHLHGQAGVLVERGLVRPLLGAERSALLGQRQRIDCFNCGAPASGQSARCGHCMAPLVVLDVTRLAQSLRARVVDEGATPAVPGQPLPWRCRACGASLDPAADATCGQCGHLVIALDLPELGPLLDAAEAALDTADAARASRRADHVPRERAARPTPRERRADEARPGGELAQDSLERSWDLTELTLDLFSTIIDP